ncbi:hypothetical protein FOCG_12096 [Fusarium oxysporum f. sp. radicis-lycopersici 26381]|uniref:Uncharacterized protein n=2 Tax=Fusarium oxysporum TaxID=5507 RepID=W9HK76_FUSOX|nr:hypothetical protein FOYG_16542 [Fusarium oxysporum NRRL 32931]EWZ49306.1 hypothetical protein FOZG_00260 [Fusarium oxysporum Fo47]EWZ89245.1 hypothetical protein FOWG_08961 [Fusarium oxysporum f. sp. lycopersici MN25]EXL46117.1 hypothetical protein FOCG_12096 [Fusarium oxysporum f. sp. radicis-lycopersici 26381]
MHTIYETELGMDRDEKLGLSSEGIWEKGLRVQ